IVGIVGIGLVVMIILLASIGSQVNENDNSNSNVRIANRNTNSSNSNNSNANTNTNTVPTSLTDDFSDSHKWGTSTSRFGDIWYANDEYHMRSKKDTYIVMYGPSEDYKTENANVKVTAQTADG